MKKAIVLCAGGFIGSHMVSRLKLEGFYVIGVDVKYPEYVDVIAGKRQFKNDGWEMYD